MLGVDVRGFGNKLFIYKHYEFQKNPPHVTIVVLQ